MASPYTSLLFSGCIIASAACSSSGGGSTPDSGTTSDTSTLPPQDAGPDSGSGADAGIACTTSNLVGTWQAAYTGNSTWTGTFNADGTFSGSIVAAGDAEEFAGTYTVEGSVVTQTATMCSCDAVSAVVWACALVDGALVVAANGSTTVYASATPPSLSGETIGCFTNGAFTAHTYGACP